MCPPAILKFHNAVRSTGNTTLTALINSERTLTIN